VGRRLIAITAHSSAKKPGTRPAANNHGTCHALAVSPAGCHSANGKITSAPTANCQKAQVRSSRWRGNRRFVRIKPL
jgi:hypothetical protein